MARCNEFGVSICERACVAVMVPDTASCFCADCGAVCAGQFAGCGAVWARGPSDEVALLVRGGVVGATCIHPGETVDLDADLDLDLDVDLDDAHPSPPASAVAPGETAALLPVALLGAVSGVVDDLRAEVAALRREVSLLRSAIAGGSHPAPAIGPTELEGLGDRLVARLVEHFEAHDHAAEHPPADDRG